jgi:hypothetical protein
LTFGADFDEKIGKNVLPKKLTHLTFGYHFNQKLKQNVLPPNLTHLTLGNYTRKICPNVLPKSIQQVTIHNPHSVEHNNVFEILKKQMGFTLEYTL